MKTFYTSIFWFAFSISILAQDVVIVGSDGDGGDEFAFLLLRDFSAGEMIFFTEDEYSDSGDAFLNGEGHIQYTIPAGGLLEGEVITITESSGNTFTTGGGGGVASHVTGSGDWSFSFQDEIYAYSASNAASPWNTVITIHCFYWTAVISPLGDQIVSNDYPDAIYLEPNNHGGNPGNENLDFKTGSLRVNTTLADLQVIGNWNRTSGNITLSTEDFTNQMIVTALPVELIAFDAHQKDKKVQLTWSTASEINNDKFEVEYSPDGSSFRMITEIAGAGTSSETNAYSFTHLTPSRGLNYYRLKQVDLDGQSEYSSLAVVNFNTDANLIGEFHPSPSSGELVQLNYFSAKETTVEFLVYDLAGKLHISHKRQVRKGKNALEFNFSTLEKGLYLIQVGNETEPIFRKLILD